jgi:hypothetical protein
MDFKPTDKQEEGYSLTLLLQQRQGLPSSFTFINELTTLAPQSSFL